MKHWPCGYWYKRLLETKEQWPRACWMPSLAMYDSSLFFVASGNWFPSPIVFLEHDMVRNTWEWIHYENQGIDADSSETAIRTADAAGQARSVAGFKGFYVYKIDYTGPIYNATVSNPAMGLWLFREGHAMTYQEFADARYETTHDTAGKMDLNAAGVVVIMRTLESTGETVVLLSDDFGASFAVVRTLTNNAARLDYAVMIDSNGDICIAYQHSATQIRFERSTDNGVNWAGPTTVTMGANITRLNFKRDATYFWCVTLGDNQRIYRSSNFTSWSLRDTFDPSATFYEAVSNDDRIAIDNAEIVYYDGSSWTLAEGNAFTALRGLSFQERLGSLTMHQGWYAYSNFNLYYEPSLSFSFIHSTDGLTWQMRQTPLNWASQPGDVGLKIFPVWPFDEQINKPKTSWNWDEI